MAAYMIGSQRATFGDDHNWIRADRYEDGIGIDRTGLHKLDRDECLQLAHWLLDVAPLIPDCKVPEEKPKRGRRKRSSKQSETSGEAA